MGLFWYLFASKRPCFLLISWCWLSNDIEVPIEYRLELCICDMVGVGPKINNSKYLWPCLDLNFFDQSDKIFCGQNFSSEVRRTRKILEHLQGFCIWTLHSCNLPKIIKKRYPMVLHLEFVFWATWQMREQTWHICQAAHGLAKGRSYASPGPRATRTFFAPYIAIASNTIAAFRCRTREGHHRDRKPSPHTMSSRTPPRQETRNESDTSRRGGTCNERWEQE